jgi:hypothetical protein
MANERSAQWLTGGGVPDPDGLVFGAGNDDFTILGSAGGDR